MRAGPRRPALRAGAAIGAVALAVAAVLFAVPDGIPGRVGRFIGAGAPAATPAIRGLAVLPLRNIGGDATQDYFADGMTAALITELAKVESLNVISQTSVMRYRERSDRSLPQIGQELGVDAIVEGSVLRVGDRVRISVDLVHASTDRHLWAQSYEQPLVDVLSLQSEVARAVVGHIQSRVTNQIVGGGPKQGRVHPEAYELFLRGELSVAQGNPTGVDRAVDYYERALTLDPDFAPAHAGLAGAHFAQEFWGTAPAGATSTRCARASHERCRWIQTLRTLTS